MRHESGHYRGGQGAADTLSLRELSGIRDMVASVCHRRHFADSHGLIDHDWNGWTWFCRDGCSSPLGLLETSMRPVETKPVTVTQRLANLAGLPAFSVQYIPRMDEDIKTLIDSLKPFLRNLWKKTDVAEFRVRQVAPADDKAVHIFSHDEFGSIYSSLKRKHECRT